MERVDLKAVDPKGSYIKLSVSLDLSSLGYERTKVRRQHYLTARAEMTLSVIELEEVLCVPEALEAHATPSGLDISYVTLSIHLPNSKVQLQVVRLQPHTIFSNCLGQTVFVRQINCSTEERLEPTDGSRPLHWESIWEPELLQVPSSFCQCHCLSGAGLLSLVAHLTSL